jgi:hypothetical protein
MVRTQIYLTREEKDGLETVSRETGKKQSELIREAVDRFLSLVMGSRRMRILNEAAGLWKDRQDLPDFTEQRRSWDRG